MNKDKKKTNKIFTIILVTLLSIALIRMVLNPIAEEYNFTKFLQDLVELSNNQIDIIRIGNLNITSDWGVFNFIRNFLNSIMSIVNIGVWWAQSVANILQVILKVIRIMLGI